MINIIVTAKDNTNIRVTEEGNIKLLNTRNDQNRQLTFTEAKELVILQFILDEFQGHHVTYQYDEYARDFETDIRAFTLLAWILEEQERSCLKDLLYAREKYTQITRFGFMG